MNLHSGRQPENQVFVAAQCYLGNHTETSAMDVTVNIKLTPTEARQLVGLPDVQPMQQAVLAKVEQRIMEQAEKISVDGLLSTWLAGGAGAIDMFRDMARRALSWDATTDNIADRSKGGARE